ncbi:MAG: metallophosphoesterase [Clostridia bacterium]|nr:metallophosphoesterase [Clostridia bacterium]
MSLFAIADTHLSFGTDKPMDVFRGWQDYEARLADNWRAVVQAQDTVVIAGDISWGMDLAQTLPDFAFLHTLPGRKLILKGNHDYWWSTRKKTETCFAQNGLDTLFVLFNNAYEAGEYAVCGTRGWLAESCSDEDRKVLLREAGRLQMSIDAAAATGKEPIVFLHYPPVNADGTWCPEIYDVLRRNGVRRCYYGHLHGASCRSAVQGELDGVRLTLISCDALQFFPKLIEFF